MGSMHGCVCSKCRGCSGYGLEFKWYAVPIGVVAFVITCCRRHQILWGGLDVDAGSPWNILHEERVHVCVCPTTLQWPDGGVHLTFHQPQIGPQMFTACCASWEHDNQIAIPCTIARVYRKVYTRPSLRVMHR